MGGIVYWVFLKLVACYTKFVHGGGGGGLSLNPACTLSDLGPLKECPTDG